MQTIKSIGWVVGLSVVAGGLFAAPTRAESSFSDITGTNIWNNTAPIFESEDRLDPELAERVRLLNQRSEEAFNACNTAIAQAEQGLPQRAGLLDAFGTESAAVPVACRQLEELRAEAENLRTTLQRETQARANPAFGTW